MAKRFVVSDFLRSQQLNPVAFDTKEQTVTVEDRAGTQQVFDVKEFVKNNKLTDATIEYNTPDNPDILEGLEWEDRAALASGNIKGGLNYLKEKYGDAAYTAENGLTVKKGGKWISVEPSVFAMSDPWEITKELAKDAAEFTPEIVSGAAVATGPVGMLARAAGYALANMVFKNVLGRAVNTYDATPTEVIQDAGLDMMFALGGEAVVLGLKATPGLVKSSLEKLKTKVGGPQKQAIIENAVGEGRTAGQLGYLVDNPEAVIHADKALKTTGGVKYEAKAAIENEQRAIMNNVAANIDDAVEAGTRRDVSGLITAPEAKNFKFEVGKAIDETIDERLISTGAVVRDAGKLRVATPQEVLQESVKRGTPVRGLSVEELPDMKKLLDEINSFKALNEKAILTGKEGAAKALALEKNFRDRLRSLNFQADSLKGISDDFSKGFQLKQGQSWANVGLGNKHAVYKKNILTRADLRNFFKGKLDGDDKIAGATRRAANLDNKYPEIREQLSELGTVMPEFQGVLEKLRAREASKAVLEIPGVAMGKSLVEAGKSLFRGSPKQAILHTAEAFSSSPIKPLRQKYDAVVKAKIDAANTVKNMSPAERDALLNDPEKLEILLNPDKLLNQVKQETTEQLKMGAQKQLRR